jgi:hypothetical protein
MPPPPAPPKQTKCRHLSTTKIPTGKEVSVRLVEKLYVALNFEVYGGVALYSASVATDAPPWVRYGVYIHLAQLIHYLKDYAFKPLNTIVRLTY